MIGAEVFFAIVVVWIAAAIVVAVAIVAETENAIEDHDRAQAFDLQARKARRHG